MSSFLEKKTAKKLAIITNLTLSGFPPFVLGSVTGPILACARHLRIGLQGWVNLWTI